MAKAFVEVKDSDLHATMRSIHNEHPKRMPMP